MNLLTLRRSAARLGLLPDGAYLYHVTFYGRLRSIAREGLRPGAHRSIGSETYDGNRKGRVFLTERAGVFHRFDKAEEWAAEYQSDSADPNDDDEGAAYTPLVLRVEVSNLPDEEQRDAVANAESVHAHAWYVTKPVPAGALEVWNGAEWVDLVGEWNSVDPATSYEFVEHGDEDRYWQLRAWRTRLSAQLVEEINEYAYVVRVRRAIRSRYHDGTLSETDAAAELRSLADSLGLEGADAQSAISDELENRATNLLAQLMERGHTQDDLLWILNDAELNPPAQAKRKRPARRRVK